MLIHELNLLYRECDWRWRNWFHPQKHTRNRWFRDTSSWLGAMYFWLEVCFFDSLWFLRTFETCMSRILENLLLHWKFDVERNIYLSPLGIEPLHQDPNVLIAVCASVSHCCFAFFLRCLFLSSCCVGVRRSKQEWKVMMMKTKMMVRGSQQRGKKILRGTATRLFAVLPSPSLAAGSSTWNVCLCFSWLPFRFRVRKRAGKGSWLHPTSPFSLLLFFPMLGPEREMPHEEGRDECCFFSTVVVIRPLHPLHSHSLSLPPLRLLFVSSSLTTRTLLSSKNPSLIHVYVSHSLSASSSSSLMPVLFSSLFVFVSRYNLHTGERQQQQSHHHHWDIKEKERRSDKYTHGEALEKRHEMMPAYILQKSASLSYEGRRCNMISGFHHSLQVIRKGEKHSKNLVWNINLISLLSLTG